MSLRRNVEPVVRLNALAFFGGAFFCLLSMSQVLAGPLEDHVDKFAHFGLSSVMVQTSMRGYAFISKEPHISTTNRICSSILTLGAGVAKEVYDRNRGGEFGYGDLAADSLGVLTGNLLFWEF